MSTLTEDDRMRIPKLKGAENYRSWAIYVQAALESRNVRDIVVTIKAAPTQPEESADKKLNEDEYTSYSQKHASAKGIFILSIDPSILINKCTTSSAKEI